MEAPPSSSPSPSKPAGLAKHFMYKNRLQEYAQRSALPLPVYQTINEAAEHAPEFRSSVIVDGMTFTSLNTFTRRKEAEQDVAKLALESISWKIRNEGVPLIHEDRFYCKMILYEYAAKVNIEKPAYSTYQSEGLLPLFKSSVAFDGQIYTGSSCRNKKEAEQMAARTAIESILAKSDTGTLMSQIIKSKGRLYSEVNQGSMSGSPCDRNVGLTSYTENNNNYILKGQEVQTAPTYHELPGSANSLDEHHIKAAATQSFPSEAKTPKEEHICELITGTTGIENLQPVLTQGSPSSQSCLSQSNLVSARISPVGTSVECGDSPGAAPDNERKRSKNEQSGAHHSKKLRTSDRPPPIPSANA